MLTRERARTIYAALRMLPVCPLGVVRQFLAPQTVRMVDADLERWVAVIQLTGWAAQTPERALAWMAASRPEFRNLFYHRVRYDPRIWWLAPALETVWKPLPTLMINTRHIGPGMFIQHGFSTIIAARSIGSGFWVNQQVTIGFSNATDCPVIGDDVRVSAGAIVIGAVTLGDGSLIGAGAVVVDDVAPATTVAGVPARTISSRGD